MNEVHLSPVGEFHSLHAANVVHDTGRFGGQLKTGRNHILTGMAHVADVDGGNTRPDNQTIGADQPEDPGHELVGAAAVVTVDHDHFDALLTVVFQHVPVGEANQVLAGRSAVRFPGTLFLGSDDEEPCFFHLVEQGVGGNEAVFLRTAVVFAVGKDGGSDTPDLVSVQRAVVAVAIEFACGCVSIHVFDDWFVATKSPPPGTKPGGGHKQKAEKLLPHEYMTWGERVFQSKELKNRSPLL